ncbi:MAG TPA: hypothetical protein VNR20_01690 [Terriglobales bacterium]|nr:hypothetical protein [Terriglobales bacterium]
MTDVHILNSWKDISAYVGRGVRTVQRWEELYGLPVHRAAGRDRSSVYALSDEVDAWLRLGKMHDAPPKQRNVTPEAAEEYRRLVEEIDILAGRILVLRQQLEVLRDEMATTRQSMLRQPPRKETTRIAPVTRKAV